MDLFNARLIIEVEIDFEKPFQETNSFSSFICSGSKLTLQICVAPVARPRIQLIL